LGKILTRALFKKGCNTVRVMDMREAQEDVSEPGKKIEFFKHELGADSPAKMQDALKGVDVVFSCLTPNLMTATQEMFIKGNVDGVKTLLEQAKVAKTPCFVHVSSIAVTGHLHESHDMTEKDPLPPISEYSSWYDITKRRGEEAVLAANGKGMKTVCVRAGGLLNDSTDYVWKDAFTSAPGKIITLCRTKAIDMVDGQDFANACILAAVKIDQPGVAGECFFVTKGTAISKEVLDNMMAKEVGWDVMVIPNFVRLIMLFVFWLVYQIRKLVGAQVAGCPMHLFLQYSGVPKTFDNKKAIEVLGYKSEITLEQSVKRIADHWRNSPNGKAYLEKNPPKKK